MDLLDVSYTKAQWRGMYSIGQVQLVWCDAGHDIMTVQQASWKASLMSGTYMLQVTRARFNQHQVDLTCLMCCKEPENVEHFLLRCESLTQVRNPFLDKIYQSLQKSVVVGHFDIIKSNDTVLTTTIPDFTTLIGDVREPVMDIFLLNMRLSQQPGVFLSRFT